MYPFRFLLCCVCILSIVGCGGSKETTTIDVSEVQQYVNENAAALADEDAIADAEDAAEDADDAAENE